MDSSINNIKCSINGDDTQFLFDAGESPYILNYDEVVKAQDEERLIKVVKDTLAGKADMRKVDRRQLSHKACVLLRNYENFSVYDKDYSFVKYHLRSKNK